MREDFLSGEAGLDGHNEEGIGDMDKRNDFFNGGIRANSEAKFLMILRDMGGDIMDLLMGEGFELECNDLGLSI